MVGSAVGVDHEVGHETGPRRLDQDMDALPRAGSADRVADDPADGIAGSNGTGPDQLLAFLQRNVSDLSRRGIKLIERAVCPGIELDRVEEPVADGLDTRRGIGAADPGLGVGWLGPGRGRNRL